ncbi:MAG: bestrophin family ion channel [Bacteroidota bacterium]
MWRSILYFFLLSVFVYILHIEFDIKQLSIPFNVIATLSTALAIYLGFKNNNAYDRWWEARKIWGLLVNYSRVWARQALTMPVLPERVTEFELQAWQRKVIYRHIAFVHALRVFLRKSHDYNNNGIIELIEEHNRFEDIREFLSPEEFEEAKTKKNPPNFLLLLQSDDLREAYKRGWLSDYRFTHLEETLTEFNNHQGRSERIKNTPLPRAYSFYSRLFVHLHGTLVPLAFIEDLGWFNIPLSLIINFVFLALDQIGERIEDPFENRMEDTPLTSISIAVEENLKEMYGEQRLPQKPKPIEGIIF